MSFCVKCGSELLEKYVDGEIRQVCSTDDCNFILWDNPVPVVAALVELNGDYIIARNASWPEDVFSLIAGYLEKGETPEQAVLRELEEELGLSGVISRYIGSYSFFEKNQLIIAYEVHASGDIEINFELAEVKTLSKSELQDYDFEPLEITINVIRDWYELVK